MFNRLVLSAALLGLAVTATPAAARETVSATVSYGDLDLNKPEGRAALDRRLARAERQVCGTFPMRDVTRIAGYRECLAEARSSYRPQVDFALANANARRVAVLADKISLFARF